jgi:dolichol-phosphate mannosyltransferase
MTKESSFWVVLPTYNEVENIQALLSEIEEAYPGLSILIVDDNSPDKTGEVAETIAKDWPNGRLKVLHRPVKAGLGSAYREGFTYALKHGADFIIQMDADFSHDPRFLADLIHKMGTCDAVIGSRYTQGISVVGWDFRRLLLSKLANFYVRIVTGLPVSDCTSGFRCIRREVIESIGIHNIHSNGYAFQVETIYRAYKKGFTIAEIHIIFTERRGGSSKMGKKVIFEALWRVPWLRLTI